MKQTRLTPCSAMSLLLLIALSLVFTSSAYSQNNTGQVILDVVQNAEPGGSVSYTLRTLAFASPQSVVLVSPDGTRFGSGRTLSRQATVPTFAEIGSRFFGEWILEETPFGPPAPFSEYGFTFSPFTLDDVFHETPIITSPSDGSTVPSSFVVKWGYPSGATRLGGGIELNSGFGAVDIFNFPTPERQARLDVDLEVLGSSPLIFRAGSRDSLDIFVSEITPSSGSGTTSYSIDSEFFSRSLRTTVRVVPEPTTASMLAVLSMAGCTRRRR